MDLILSLLTLFGHAVLWTGLVNRIHATGLSRGLVLCLSVLGLVGIVFIPIGFVWTLVHFGYRWGEPIAWLSLPKLATIYAVVCWLLAVVVVIAWAWNRFALRPVDLLWSRRSRLMDLARDSESSNVSEDHTHHFLTHLPGNQILQIDFNERALAMSRLDPRLEGLSIVHLSDLHFTGRVGKAFFHEVVCLSNELKPDLVAITGDLVDTDACIDWIPDVLGPLAARHGIFFVLGNHDLRVDMTRLRHALSDAGLVDLGGRWIRHEVNDAPIVLAGNELPWIPPAADMHGAPPGTRAGGPLRVLLSHSPDQLDWAVAHGFDLMLAGHLHGGQIRLPLIGPILAPSRQGVRFASGIFQRGPTILHVSRGLSGELPIRLNCPPELTRIVLHAVNT